MNRQDKSDNIFYISGNIPELGDFKELKKMALTRKKSNFFFEESYWEKKILIPNYLFPQDLIYNFYEFDIKNKYFKVNDMNFSVNVFEEMRFPSFEKLWSPQTKVGQNKSKFKQMTISPLKINHVLKNNMRINILPYKPKRVEKKYNIVAITNEIKPLYSFVKEINKEIIIGEFFF